MMKLRAQVTRTAMVLPPRVQTAADLSVLTGKSENWILQRTGVARRRICEGSVQELAAEAARLVLEGSEPPDLILNASLTPVQLIPDTSVFQLAALGIEGIPAFSIHATCLSFMVALHQAANLVSTGAYRRILILSAEQGSKCRDMDEPESAVLIGDGAAAAMVVATPAGHPSELLAWQMATFPSGRAFAQLRGCGVGQFPLAEDTVDSDYYFHMNGPKLFRHAYKHVHTMLERLFDGAGVSREDVSLIVPHQASGRALQAIESLGFPSSRTVNLIAEHGNCIAASIPMALAHADAAGRLQRGDTVLLMGTGAGLSVAGMLLRW